MSRHVNYFNHALVILISILLILLNCLGNQINQVKRLLSTVVMGLSQRKTKSVF